MSTEKPDLPAPVKPPDALEWVSEMAQRELHRMEDLRNKNRRAALDAAVYVTNPDTSTNVVDTVVRRANAFLAWLEPSDD